MPNRILRNLPSVNELIESPPLKKLVDRVSHHVVVNQVRQFLDKMRHDVQTTTAEIQIPAPQELAERIAQWILQEEKPALRPVINATGILLHTGLGRAPLATEALAAVQEIAQGYASVEIDLGTGERSVRTQAVEKLLCEVTGAEAATVVNNNAAATLLTLAALATGREVVVSRGQLIEIGGSYRLPDVMSASGARLREVGTTNKTRLSDYADAIGEETAALMRVHTSNFRIVGFTQEVSLAELVRLGRQRHLPVIDDIGSGAVIDLSHLGISDEPIARQSIAEGADVVLFSGDKLLGGPQCGIIAGRKELVQKMMRHPLMRAMRVDKITLAALGATLRCYRDPQRAAESIPLLRLLGTSMDNLKNRAERLAPQLAATSAIASAEPVEQTTYLGGGSVPTQAIPTWCVAMTPAKGSLEKLAAALRQSIPAVLGRVQKDRLLFDLRTVFPDQDSQLADAVRKIGDPSAETADPAEESGAGSDQQADQ